MALHFFAQSETDSPDGYAVGISGQGAWRMWVQENGSLSRIASTDLPTSDQVDGWYRAEVWTDDLTVYADLYDDSTDERLASIEADDTTWASGGIGFRLAGNGEVWDHVTHQADRDPNVIGGAGYPRTMPPSEADYFVSTLSELQSAFDSASRGDVVYVDPDAEIYTGSRELAVPEGITLASDRGIDGSDGGLLYTDQDPWAMLELWNPGSTRRCRGSPSGTFPVTGRTSGTTGSTTSRSHGTRPTTGPTRPSSRSTRIAGRT